MPRILILDEHTVYRVGLARLTGAKFPGAEVVEATNLNEVLLQIRERVFNLALVGIQPSSSEALDFLKTAREASPATRFAVLATSASRSAILASLAAGFHGFISKQWSDIEVLGAITDILSGRIYVPPSCAETGNGNGNAIDVRSNGSVAASSLQATFRKLTKRQLEVLALLADGRSNKEIARALCIAEATTKIHVAGLLRTLGVSNRTEAIFRAANLVNLARS